MPGSLKPGSGDGPVVADLLIEEPLMLVTTS
jgi:hypothetical protein